jgi:DNA repair protein RadC
MKQIDKLIINPPYEEPKYYWHYDREHRSFEKRIVTIGLVNSSQIHPREVFADVIADCAAAVIFAHNHPSGDPKPSDVDTKTHRQLTEAGTILGLRILDHIIVTKKGYFSFQEAGLIG